MSGLIIPGYRKHWKTNWDALLMSLRLSTSHLTYTPSNHLALCSCVCDVEATDPTECECQTSDYTAYKTIGALTVTISGSATPTAATSPACTAPGSCSSLAGTYVIACADDRDQHWRVDDYVCTSGGYDYYYANTIRINYGITSGYDMFCRLGSNKVRLTAGDPNPYPTLTTWAGPQPTGGGAVLYEHRKTEAFSSYNRWIYVLGGTCEEECNTSTTIQACPTSGTLTLSTSYISGSGSSTDVCHPSSYSVSASVAVSV